MKIDPYKHKKRYQDWKEKNKDGISDVSKFNSDLILQYLNDMEKGINIAHGTSKGSRSFIRLNTLRDKMCFFAKKFLELYKLERIIDINENQLIGFFSDMKNGNLKKIKGGNYTSVDTYAKVFKAFWHWHIKVNRKNGESISDITEDLDSRAEKPEWVYLTEEQVKEMCNKAKFEYKVLIMFLFDTGIRSPSELINIKVSDLCSDFKELNIRDEISKTFGRKIKLMICSELLRDYIKYKKISDEDYLFPIEPPTVNKYLKRLAKMVFGDGRSLAGQKYSHITMYDFRHISCCYWLPRYKSESALKYRFGWKKSDKIHYYSELLGMKDTIQEEDLFLDTTKTEIEREQIKLRKENEMLKDKVDSMGEQMKEILSMVKGMCEKVKLG
ncbi:MAG: tyrosine-type recombinase/integrase [archaeon]|nr:tyrosine-type recombinase/integrase [archaeon]